MPPSVSQEQNIPASADEITPLLAKQFSDPKIRTNGSIEVQNQERHDENADAEEEEDEQDKTPLPIKQIFILCIARLTDPIAFFSIFPFVPSMVKSMGVAEEDVGLYTGLIESLFSIVQMFTMIFWGRLADRYGRKPILVFSLGGLAVTGTLFGTSKTIWQMILFRCMAGLFSGSVVTIRTMFSESSTPHTQARAFSFFAFAGNLGIFLGPLIGGLAKPTEQYPDLFGDNKLFNAYPFLLPTMISGLIVAVSTLTCAFLLKEGSSAIDFHNTLKVDTTSDSDDTTTKKRVLPMTTLQLLRTPGIPITLAIYTYAGMLGFAYTAMIPVFWFTSIPNGGFSFPPKLISLFLSISGVSQALWLLLVFPPLQRRIGTGGVLRLCTMIWPITFLSSPLYNILLRQHWTSLFWAVAPASQALGSFVAMAFTAVQLALNDVTPHPNSLGTLNGVALTLQSAVRAVTPALASGVYAFGVSHRVLWGQLGWAVLLALAFGYKILVRFLPEKAEGRPKGRKVVGRGDT